MVRLTLPSILANLIRGPRSLELDASTVREALEELFQRHPTLRIHFFDEGGRLRPFVLCYVNEDNAAWHEGLDTPLSDGDELTIIQSVQGG